MALAYVSQPSRPFNEPQKFQGHHPWFEDWSNSSFSEKLSVICSKVASKSSSVHLVGHRMRKIGRPSGSKNKVKCSNYRPAKSGRHILGHPDTRPIVGHLQKGQKLGSFPVEGLGDTSVGPPGTGPVGGHLQRGPLQGFFPTEGLGDTSVGPPGTGPVGEHLQRGPLQGLFPTEGLGDAPVGPPRIGPVGGYLPRGPLQGFFPTEGHEGTTYEQRTPTGVINYPYGSPVQASISNQGPTGSSPHVYAQSGSLQSVAMPMHVSEGPVMTFGGLFPQGGHQRAHGGQQMPRRDAPMLHRGQPIPNGGYPMQHGGPPRGDQVSPIQRMLDENAILIRTISDFQNVGRNEEILHHQSMLHKNLMYLTGLATEI
jgi:hypothetical protein